jgi:excinuclease ABC subunit C
MIVAGPEGFRKNQYRKFNIRSTDLTPGDDFGMMREVLERRFKRLIAEAPRGAPSRAGDPLPSPPVGDDRIESHAMTDEGTRSAAMDTAGTTSSPGVAQMALSHPLPQGEGVAEQVESEDTESEAAESPWPDLVIIDGGQGQLTAAREALAALGITDVPLVAIAKGPDRDAGRETFFLPGREPFKLKPRDPVLYFIQRLRDEAHRFAIGSHRQRRRRDIREAGLQEIPGIGPTRKRALLQHFGTLKAIERASLADLAKVPGISDETARKIYGFFHERAG